MVVIMIAATTAKFHEYANMITISTAKTSNVPEMRANHVLPTISNNEINQAVYCSPLNYNYKGL